MTDPRDIPRSLPGAYTVLVDALMARVIASAQAAQTTPVPVLFLAADPGPIDYEAALACHADRAFIIPAEIKDLLAAIAQAAHPPEDRPGSAPAAAAGRAVSRNLAAGRPQTGFRRAAATPIGGGA